MSNQEHSSGERIESPRAPEQGLAGRELDAAVAERVFGWRSEAASDPTMGDGFRLFDANGTEVLERYVSASGTLETHPMDAPFLPCYSTDIAAAMEVVAKMDAANFILKRFGGTVEGAVVWNAEFLSPDGIACDFTAPAVICRAALAAVAHNAPAN